MDIKGYQDAANVAGFSSTYTFSPYKNEQEVVCPNCGKSMFVNQKKNIHHCFHCGFGGSVIDFYASLVGIDKGNIEETRSAAGKDFDKRVLGRGENEIRKRKNIKPEAPTIVQYDIADLQTRNHTYSQFLTLLTLNDIHKNDLLRRGLSEETISTNRYRSAPIVASGNICAKLLEKGCTLEGVPGFYKSKGEWKFVNYGAGYLIPTRAIDGSIQGLQLRTEQSSGEETEKKVKRYYTISSAAYDSGTKGRTFPHFNPGKTFNGTLVLTEGPLKGDVISAFSGSPSLAVLGVNCLDTLPEIFPRFRSQGFRKVQIAYDMDMYSNPNVMAAYKDLKKKIISAGLSIETLQWNTEYKGLDDYLLMKNQQPEGSENEIINV